MSFKGLSSSSHSSSTSTYERRSQSQKAKSSHSSSGSSSSATGGATSLKDAAAEGGLKIVLVGDSGVGKSCLLDKLVDSDSTNNFISTIGVDVRTTVHNFDGATKKLQVWDTGGQQRYRPVLASCYRNADGVILVFDVTNEKSFANLPQWLSEVEEFSEKGKSAPKLLLVGNKSDLVDRRRVQPEAAEKFAAERKMVGYVETSSVGTIVNVKRAFATLIQKSK